MLIQADQFNFVQAHHFNLAFKPLALNLKAQTQNAETSFLFFSARFRPGDRTVRGIQVFRALQQAPRSLGECLGLRCLGLGGRM